MENRDFLLTDDIPLCGVLTTGCFKIRYRHPTLFFNQFCVIFHVCGCNIYLLMTTDGRNMQ